jgi:hypothetical protein
MSAMSPGGGALRDEAWHQPVMHGTLGLVMSHQGSGTCLALVACVYLGACGPGSSSNPRTGQSELAADSGLYVGGPCQRADGWQPPDPGIGMTFDGSPVAESPPDAAWLDFNQLPPGIGYCLAPGPVYPNGYFTMNCSVDTECQSPAFCEGASRTTVGQCRRQCFSDADCPAGTTCGGTPKGFCQGTAPTARQASN